MRYAVADCRISEKCKDTLGKYADKILLLPPHPALDAPVASHPDMLMWVCGKTVVTYSDYYALASDVFDELMSAGFEVILSGEAVSFAYPHDVKLNCALVGNCVFGRADAVSESIKKIIVKNNLNLINTRQGYAKCSTAIVSKNAIITADRGICSLACGAGLDVLSVSPAHVSLDGYDTGFIGGATASCEDALLFCGDLDTHPDAESIRSFCRKHSKKAVSLSDEPLYDYGTIFIL